MVISLHCGQKSIKTSIETSQTSAVQPSVHMFYHYFPVTHFSQDVAKFTNVFWKEYNFKAIINIIMRLLCLQGVSSFVTTTSD